MIRFEPRARAPLALRLGTQVGAVAAALRSPRSRSPSLARRWCAPSA